MVEGSGATSRTSLPKEEAQLLFDIRKVSEMTMSNIYCDTGRRCSAYSKEVEITVLGNARCNTVLFMYLRGDIDG